MNFVFLVAVLLSSTAAAALLIPHIRIVSKGSVFADAHAVWIAPQTTVEQLVQRLQRARKCPVPFPIEYIMDGQQETIKMFYQDFELETPLAEIQDVNFQNILYLIDYN